MGRQKRTVQPPDLLGRRGRCTDGGRSDRQNCCVRKERAGVSGREVVIVLLFGVMVLGGGMIYLQSTIHDSKAKTCRFHLQKTFHALQSYSHTHRYLPGYLNPADPFVLGEPPRQRSWAAMIIPHMDEIPVEYQRALIDQKDLAGASSIRIPILICPTNVLGSGEEQAHLTWVANSGMIDQPSIGENPPDWRANGVFHDRTVPNQVTMSFDWINEHDGTGYTFMVSENTQFHEWLDQKEEHLGFMWEPGSTDGMISIGKTILPLNAKYDILDQRDLSFARPASLHIMQDLANDEPVVNFLFCSGEVRAVPANIDYQVYLDQMLPAVAKARMAGTGDPLPDAYQLPSSTSGEGEKGTTATHSEEEAQR